MPALPASLRAAERDLAARLSEALDVAATGTPAEFTVRVRPAAAGQERPHVHLTPVLVPLPPADTARRR